MDLNRAPAAMRDGQVWDNQGNFIKSLGQILP